VRAAASFALAAVVAHGGGVPRAADATASGSPPAAAALAVDVAPIARRPVPAVLGHPVPTRPDVRMARRPRPSLLVSIPHAMPVTRRAGGGPTIGWMPGASKYYGTPLIAWVLQESRDHRYGRVTIPYSGANRTGWIPLTGLARHSTPYRVDIDLSEHRLTVTRFGAVVFRARGATGAPGSATPLGRYFVTDRVPFSRGSALGTFAFGISGVQPNLPPGWRDGDQLAIHGTNAPWTIGRSASAGCVRVSEAALAKLKSWLQLGTPVIIQA
jgi:lipoprotein-anchoring transpeptidase ErfK/SrfK